jgi:predicted nuclease of predicted toxin-antitoxin system
MISDLPEWLQEPAHSIDAAVFSSDTFFDKDKREALRDLLQRWDRGLTEQAAAHEASLTEDDDTEALERAHNEDRQSEDLFADLDRLAIVHPESEPSVINCQTPRTAFINIVTKDLDWMETALRMGQLAETMERELAELVEKCGNQGTLS